MSSAEAMLVYIIPTVNPVLQKSTERVWKERGNNIDVLTLRCEQEAFRRDDSFIDPRLLVFCIPKPSRQKKGAPTVRPDH
jgi:hypothetical protein